MPASGFTKFDCWVRDLAAGVHAGWLNADTDVLSVYLTNTLPNRAMHTVKADVPEIETGNGYTGAVPVQNGATRANGVITVTAVGFVLTAAGGTIGPFRYAVLCNASALDIPLVGWWGYPDVITLQPLDIFRVTLGSVIMTVQ